jgi:hypothetical protein
VERLVCSKLFGWQSGCDSTGNVVRCEQGLVSEKFVPVGRKRLVGTDGAMASFGSSDGGFDLESKQ